MRGTGVHLAKRSSPVAADVTGGRRRKPDSLRQEGFVRSLPWLHTIYLI
jgi:hypothetical protein